MHLSGSAGTPHAAPARGRDGLLTRAVTASMPPRVDYSLTPLGNTLIAPMNALRQWAETNMDAVLAARERYDQNVVAS